MQIIRLPFTMFRTPFVLYGIDDDCDYVADDMEDTNIEDVVLTHCQEPKKWAKENLGHNESPIAIFDGEKLLYHKIYSTGYVVELVDVPSALFIS